MRISLWVGVAFSLLLTGCSSSGGAGATARLSAKFIAGANTTARGAAPAVRAGRPADGKWAITPDKAIVDFTQMVFVTEDGTSETVALADCQATFDRADTSGDEVLDCDIDVPEGTYTSMQVVFSNDIQVLVDDAVNGFFSVLDATPPISTTAPTGGNGELTPFPEIDGDDTPSERSYETLFTTPLVVSAESTPDIYITADLNHTIRVDVTGGEAEIPVQNRPIQLFATHTSNGTATFYTTESTADTVYEGNAAPYEYWVRVYLNESNEAFSVLTEGRAAGLDTCVPGEDRHPFQAFNISPEDAPLKEDGSRLGGFLGEDGGILAWVFATDLTWETYTSLYTMETKTAIGDATTIHCESMATAPDPADGETYASGTPAITPTISVGLALRAN